jgi:hypothetical protein
VATLLGQNLKPENTNASLAEKVKEAFMNLESPNLENQNLKSQWTVYRTRFLVRAQQLTAPLVFTDALGRVQSGQPGDYLVESSEGIRRITTQALFEDIYVPLSQNKNHGALALARPVSRAAPPDRARASA